MKLKQALEESPDFKAAYDGSEQVRDLVDTARRLEGLTRHDSVHAAGVVIAADPLWENVPLQRADDGIGYVTQYPAAMLEKIGLLKMDFLGLANLTILSRAVKNVKATTGREIDVWNLPLDDPATYELLGRGDCTGIFQLESAQMRRHIAELKPGNVHEIAAMVALYRPGPMAHIPRYIRCKHGLEKIKYPHPALEPILKETYGVIVYQDQVLLIVRAIAGFSLGQADILRKAMGKKDRDEMARQREKFIAGAIANGTGQVKAEELFSLIEPFAGYAFNKAHAACYAMVAYQTAYLKANYPVEYFAALMATQSDDTDKLCNFIDDARRQRIPVLPPDVNTSDADFTVEEGAIRFGLCAIKNVGRGQIDLILAARSSGGKFKGLTDFCSRVQESTMTSKAAVETLIKAGAMASIERERARVLAGLENAWTMGQKALQDRKVGQGSMFGDGDVAVHNEGEPSLPTEYRAFTPQENMAFEKELLGVYISDHPLDRFAEKLEKLVTHSVEAARHCADREPVKLAGVIANVRPYYTKGKNEQMYFITLEDKTGSMPVTLFPRAATDYGPACVKDSVVLIEGRISYRDRINKTVEASENNGVGAELAADKVLPIASAEALLGTNGGDADATEAAGDLHIRLTPRHRGRLRPLYSALSSHPGNGTVTLHLSAGSHPIKIKPFISVAADANMVDYIRSLLGGTEVWLA
jgi:DNA polymerase-3 subunit alpha